MLSLQTHLEEPFETEHGTFIFSALVGAAPYSGDATLARSIELAEFALARAEADGARCVLADESQQQAYSDRLALMRDLRYAMSRGDPTMVYQPKLNVRRGEVDSAEALVR